MGTLKLKKMVMHKKNQSLYTISPILKELMPESQKEEWEWRSSVFSWMILMCREISITWPSIDPSITMKLITMLSSTVTSSRIETCIGRVLSFACLNTIN
jgi:hypothetical protein